MHWTVDVLQLGRTHVPTMEINWMDIAKLDQWEPLIYIMVVLRSGDWTVVINTGPPRATDDLNTFWKSLHPMHELIIQEDERPVQALAKLGVDPASVRHVLITPIAAYATGNLDLFPNADIWMSERGWRDVLVPEPYAHRLPEDIYMPSDIREWLLNEASGRIRLLGEEEEEFLPGIRSFFTGGHHRSSMAYVIRTKDGGEIVVSDCFFKYRNVERGIPLGINESMEETLRSYERIRKIGGTLLPLYDPEVFDRHPGGRVAGEQPDDRRKRVNER